MSQSTTTAGSQSSQNETCDQVLRLNYPDRQDEYPSQDSFVPLTQLPDEKPNQPSTQTSNGSVCYDSLSATPTPNSEDDVKKAIAKINTDLSKHGYKAFVHGNTHFMFKTYPFDL